MAEPAPSTAQIPAPPQRQRTGRTGRATRTKSRIGPKRTKSALVGSLAGAKRQPRPGKPGRPFKAEVKQALRPKVIIQQESEDLFPLTESRTRTQDDDRLVVDIDELEEMSIVGISLAPIDIEEMAKIAFRVTSEKDLDSPLLGFVSNIGSCDTCTHKKTMCTGHIGIIEFEEFINHPNSVGLIESVLNCICWTCNRLTVSIEEMVRAELLIAKEDSDPSKPESYIFTLDPYKHLEQLVILSKQREHCHECSTEKTRELVERVPETDDPLNTEIDPKTRRPKFVYARKLTFASSSNSKDNTASGLVGEIFFSAGGKDAKDKILSKGAILRSSHIYDRFRYLSDRDVYLLGFRGRSHPKNLIMKGITVIPKRDRPKTTTGGSSDALTTSYKNILQANSSIMRLKSMVSNGDKDKGLLAKRGELKLHVRKIISAKSSQNSRSQTKESVNEMMIGKNGTVRAFLSSMRTNFSGRTVAGTDPSLNVDEVGVPEEFAKKLTVKETVTSENIDYLQSLVNSEKVTFIVVKVKNELGSSEWKFRRNIKSRHGTYKALSVGDIVHRHLQNGDWAIMSRQPLLTRHSRMAHKVRLVPGLSLMMSISVTKPYNLDFDGDEININIPQTVPEESIKEISVQKCIVSDKHNAPMIGLIYDGPNAMFLLTGGWARSQQREYVLVAELDQMLTSLGMNTIARDDPRILRRFIKAEENIGPGVKPGGRIEMKIKMADALTIANNVISSLSNKPSEALRAWSYLSPILIEQSDFMFEVDEFMSIANSFYINVEAEYVYARMNSIDAAVLRQKEYDDLHDKIDRVLRKAIRAGLLPKPPLHYSIEIADDGLPVNIVTAVRISAKRHHEATSSLDEFVWKIPGRILFSLLLPDDFNYENYGIKIIDGLLVSGTVTGKAVGPKHNSIVHELYLQYDDPDNRGWTAKRFIDNGNRLNNRFIEMHGITISAKDCFVEEEKREETEEEKARSLFRIYEEIYTRPKPSDDPEEKLREEEQKVHLLTASRGLSKQLVGPDNSIRMIRDSGAKGGLFNQQYIVGRIGQQLADGMRIETEFGEEMDRSSPYVRPGEEAIEARGYCTSNFGEGINEIEFIATQGVGRLALVSAAVSTAGTGDVQRRLSKGLEGIVQDKRGPAVSVATQNIYQMTYGNIALYPAHMILDKFPEGKTASFVELSNDIKLFERNWMEVPVTYLQEEVIDAILSRFSPVIPSPVEEHSIELTEELKKRFRTKFMLTKTRVNETNADEFVDLIVSSMVEGYNRAIMPPGIAAGMRAAGGVSEPATQMTLSTFHTAGSQGSVGFENVQELIYLTNVSKKITYLYFKPINISNHPDIKPSDNDVMIDGKRWKFHTFEDVYELRKQFRHFTIDDIVTQLENVNYNGPTMVQDGHLNPGEQMFTHFSRVGEKLKTLSWYYKITLNLRLMAIYDIDVNDVIDAIMEKKDTDAYIPITGYPEDGVLKIFVDTEQIVRDEDEDDSKLIAKNYTMIFDDILKKTTLRGYEGIGEIFIERTGVAQVYMGVRRVNSDRDDRWKVFINSNICFQKGVSWLAAARPFVLMGFSVSDFEFLDYVTTEEESKIPVSFIIEARDEMESGSDPLMMLQDMKYNAYIQEALHIKHLAMNGINNRIFARGDISYTFSTTNDVKHTQNALGVVAAKSHLFERLWTVMSTQSGYVHPVHVQLAVDWMAFPGVLSAYNEKGFKNHGKDIDPMARAMYVKALDVLHNASNIGDDMNASTFSTALATGQLPIVGKRYEQWRKKMIELGKIPKQTTTLRSSLAVDRGDDVDVDAGVGTGSEFRDSDLTTVEEQLDDIVGSMYDELLGIDEAFVMEYDGGSRGTKSEDTATGSGLDGDDDGLVFDNQEESYDFEDPEDPGDPASLFVQEPPPVIYDAPTGREVGPVDIVESKPVIDKFKKKAFLAAIRRGRDNSSCVRTKRRRRRRSKK